MQGLGEVSRTKDRILSTLRAKGPCLPVQISKEINFSPLFASAFLSELKSEDKIKISSMRVGSSPLYYLPEHQLMLEKFSGYLNQREKEAFFLLREKKILEDSEQDPVMRVALRAIKDFAISFSVKIKDEQKTFWRYFSIPESEAVSFTEGKAQGIFEKKIALQEKSNFETIDKKNISEKKEEVKLETEHLSKMQEVLDGDKRPLAEKRNQKNKESEFAISVKDYLSSKEIEVVEVFAEKKKEFEARIRIDTLFGKQEFYLTAKEKKNVSEQDFVIAHQKAQEKKIPAAVMATGDLNKKGKEHLEEWGNLIKFEKLKF